MSALGSSVINKSTKKFAQKRAPARRFEDGNSSQNPTKPLIDQSAEPQAIQKEINDSTRIASSAASSSTSKRPRNPPAFSPALQEQTSGNTPLPIPSPNDDPSLPLNKYRGRGPSQGKSSDQPRIHAQRGALIPSSEATSSRTDLVADAVERVVLNRTSQSSELEHADTPPPKRRRVTSRRHQTENSPRDVLPADQNGAMSSGENRQEEANDQEMALKIIELAQTNEPRAPSNDVQKQNKRKSSRSGKQRAVNLSRKPRQSGRNVVEEAGSRGELNEENDAESVQQEASLDTGRSGRKQSERSTRTRGRKPIEDAAAAIVEDAIHGSSMTYKKKGRRSKRASTPDDAQYVQIDVGETKMADLCRDGGTGQKSSADKIIRENERATALKKKRQEAQSLVAETDDATIQASEVRESRLDRLDREWRQREEAMANVVPQQRIVNGEIVLDTTSLRIDRHAMAAVERDAEQMESVEEDEYTRKVNSSLGIKRDNSGGWNEILVDRFYEGLRMFGTDFGMISKLFPGKSRHAIKLKFCKEERGDYPRIRATLLGEAQPVELEEFQKMTGQEYDDPSVLERDIEEDKKKLEEEQEKEKEAIENARRERAEQAEAERLASQGQESSSKESQKRAKKKSEHSKRGKRKGEKVQKSPARANEKKSPVVESISPFAI